MGKITLDPELRARLNGLNEKMEVCDENDEPVGIFLPQGEYMKLLHAHQRIPFSDDEIERMRQSGGGCSLADIWKRLDDGKDQTEAVPRLQENYRQLLAKIEIPFSAEEIERRRQSGGGCSLEEIWVRLEKAHNVKIDR